MTEGSRNGSSLRLTLDEEATKAVGLMLERIKQEHPGCSLSPSALGSWIIIHFSEIQFNKMIDKIAGAHFNPKAFLRAKLKEVDSPEKLEEILSSVREKLRGTSKRVAVKKEAQVDD